MTMRLHERPFARRPLASMALAGALLALVGTALGSIPMQNPMQEGIDALRARLRTLVGAADDDTGIDALRARLRTIADATDDASFLGKYWEHLYELGHKPFVLHGDVVVIGNGVRFILSESLESDGWVFQLDGPERIHLPAGPWVRFVGEGWEGLSQSPPADGTPAFVLIASPDALAIVNGENSVMRRITR